MELLFLYLENLLLKLAMKISCIRVRKYGRLT